MSSWFKVTDESLKFLAEERLMVQAVEAVYEALEGANVSRAELASRIGVKPSEISQRLSGKRNLTMRSFADMLHSVGKTVKFVLEPEHPRGFVLLHVEGRTTLGGVKYTSSGTHIRIVEPAA